MQLCVPVSHRRLQERFEREEDGQGDKDADGGIAAAMGSMDGLPLTGR